MSALDWLNGEAFTAFGQHVIWSDMIGNTARPGRPRARLAPLDLTWPAQLLSGVVLVAAYASAHLSGGVGKQLVVIGVAVWGWAQWRRGRRRPQAAPSPSASPPGASGPCCSAATAVGTARRRRACSRPIPQLSWNPWPDAYIFVGTLAAMVAQARGWVEFWFAWLLVDVVGVPLAFSSGLAFSGLVYVVYFVLVAVGHARLVAALARATERTVLEGAAA